jgi:hypothetical protein
LRFLLPLGFAGSSSSGSGSVDDGRGASAGKSSDAFTKTFTVGHSRRHPSATSRSVLPPVMTIFPEKKHSRTTGEACGR